MPTTAVVIIVLAVLLDLLIVPLIIRAAIRAGWKRLQDTHPAADVGPDAVRKNFQSFKMGMMNLGLSVHVAVDDAHPHLLPAAMLRLFGAKPMSIPWDAIEIKYRGKWSTRTTIAGANVWGPNWCFDLVSPDQTTENGSK